MYRCADSLSSSSSLVEQGRPPAELFISVNTVSSHRIGRCARSQRCAAVALSERRDQPGRLPAGQGRAGRLTRRAATARSLSLRRRSAGPPRPCARAAAAQLGAAWQLPPALGAVWLAGLAGLGAGRWGALPGDRQLVAFAEPFDVTGDDALDPLQAFLICGFGPQRQRARSGLHGALAPAEADHPAGFGAFDAVDLGRRLPVTAVIARPVAQAVDLPGVFAELGEVPGWLFGLDVGFGCGHDGPFHSCPARKLA